jgi:hypothetical protein
MMSTEFDLSFGKSVGFAVAVRVRKARKVPVNAAAGDRRTRWIDLITFPG